MSSFLKTSFVHDETAPSESLVLHLKRSSADNIISTSSSFSPFPVPLHASSVLRLASTRGRRGLQATSWWGHARPCPCPGALCEGWTGSPTVDLRGQLIYSTGVWARQSCDSRTLALDPKSISFLAENVRFVIFHPKLALPPPPVSKCVTFRKKLRTYEMLP